MPNCGHSESRDRRTLPDDVRSLFCAEHGTWCLILNKLPVDLNVAISALKSALDLSPREINEIAAELPGEYELTRGPEPIVRALQDILDEAGAKTAVERLAR